MPVFSKKGWQTLRSYRSWKPPMFPDLLEDRVVMQDQCMQEFVCPSQRQALAQALASIEEYEKSEAWNTGREVMDGQEGTSP